MDNIFCQYCGTPNKADARFCRVCGRQFDAASQSPSVQQPIHPQQPVTPQYPQQANIPLQPVAVASPPKRKKLKILIIGLIIGLAGVCAVFFGYVLIFIQPIQNTANDFLSTLQRKDYSSAYAMMSADIQDQLVSADGLKAYMKYNGLVFLSYKSTSVSRISGNSPRGTKIVELELQDGSTYTFEVDLVVGPDDTWQVTGDYSGIRQEPVEKLVKDFLDALQAQDYTTAYNMTSVEVKTQLGSEAALQNFMESNGLEFSAYKSDEATLSSDNPPQAVELAEVTLLDGSKTQVEVDMKVGPDDVWEVIGFFFPEK